jgi:allantoinase
MKIFRSQRAVTAEGERPAAVHVAGGRITQVTGFEDVPPGAEVIDLGETALLPGFVDSHVHINEPGRTEWEGFETATRAAAAGGVTTLVDMPLNSIPATTSESALRAKLAATDGKLLVDVAFWGGVVPGNAPELHGLHEAGACGFKCFLVPSGVDEFPSVSYHEMEAAMAELAALDAPLLVHAEDPRIVATAPESRDPGSYVQYARTRPVAAETEAVRQVLAAAGRTGARIHVVHVSAPETLREIEAARDAHQVIVTAETCPHYLWFAAEEIPRGGVQWKCAPPIRDSTAREQLRAALRDGAIDMVVSDHSPAPADAKKIDTGDFSAAWGGISSLEIAPRLTWTVASSMGCTLPQLCSWISAAPAALAGLHHRKGRIAPGLDADLVAFDPDAEERVVASELHHRHNMTPYEGAVVRGRVLRTWLRGEAVFEAGMPAVDPRGRTLLRGQA